MTNNLVKENKDRLTEPKPLHRVLREVLRHYTEFKSHVSATGDHVLTHGYKIYPEDGEPYKQIVTISFWDLHRGIKDLSPRKKQALYWNVIRDERQKDVAARMNITTVSVGQYVEQACIQLAEEYFSEEYEIQREHDELRTKTTVEVGEHERL